MSSQDLVNILNSEFNKNVNKKPQSDVIRENYFDKIPNEILLMIFETLKYKESKNLIYVCMRFKNLLFTSKSFTRNLKLKIDKRTRFTSFEDLPYNKISIDDGEKAHMTKRSLKILKDHEITVKRLKVQYAPLEYAINFISEVKNNLTLLSLSTIYSNSLKNEIKVDLPNLTKLKLYNASFIVKHIGEHKIEEMDIHDYNSNFEEHKILDNFLKTFNSLRRLILRKFYVPTYDPEVHKYQIEYLKCFDDNMSKESIENFLQHHKESLKKLILLNYYGDNELIMIEIEDLSFSSESEFKPNYSIKKLILILGIYNQYPIYQRLMGASKSVENLDFSCSDHISIPQNTLKIISENMKNLKHLTLPRMTSIIESLHFNKLETLRIFDLMSKDEHKSWISLATCCPNLKKIFITQSIENKYNSGCSFSIASSDLKNLLNSCKNFQEIHIGPHFDITDEFIETILNSESKSFWYLKIESEDFEEDGERVKKFEGTKIRCEVVRSIKLN